MDGLAKPQAGLADKYGTYPRTTCFQSIGISDLREAPARMFERAGETPVVVLNHNRPAGYIVFTQLMARILTALSRAK